MLPPGVNLDLDLDPGVVGVLSGQDANIWALIDTAVPLHQNKQLI